MCRPFRNSSKSNRINGLRPEVQKTKINLKRIVVKFKERRVCFVFFPKAELRERIQTVLMI